MDRSVHDRLVEPKRRSDEEGKMGNEALGSHALDDWAVPAVVSRRVVAE